MTKLLTHKYRSLIGSPRFGAFSLSLIFLICAVKAFAGLPLSRPSDDTKQASAGPHIETTRVRWRFKMQGQYSFVRPVVAGNGTIYFIDNIANLYALDRKGKRKWILPGAGNKGLALGPDGTIYTASESDIKAINPDGTIKWQFDLKPRAFITLGVSVGPDGNIYSVAVESLGVFSLTPQGTLRWSTPEQYSRPIVEYGEIVFGPNPEDGQQQLYFYANARIRAVRLSDGETIFPLGQLDQPFGQPAVSPLDGTVHANVVAYTPAGDLLWNLFPIYNSSISFPAANVGIDGVHYVVYPGRRLYAVNPDGSIKYLRDFDDGFGNPVVSPDNSVLVIGTAGDVNANFVAGFNPANGNENWRETLPLVNGLGQFFTTRARFTPDSATALLHTATADGPNSASFLYAINAVPDPENITPHAVASADRTAGRAPITIYFSSANSSDPDGTIVSYQWDFGDGTGSSEANPAHVYNSAGNYTAKLTVTDNRGATNDTFVNLQFTSGGCVTNCARVTVLNLSFTQAAGTNYRVTATIRVQNELGQPLANASVKVIWDTPSAGPAFTRTVVTNSEGYAESAVTSIAGPYTVGTVTIENIPGYTFDEGNSVRFAAITAGP